MVTIGETARLEGVRLARQMRQAGLGAILANGGRALRGQMRQANALGVSTALILGDNEVSDGTVVIRDMETSRQETVAVAKFLNDAGAS